VKKNVLDKKKNNCHSKHELGTGKMCKIIYFQLNTLKTGENVQDTAFSTQLTPNGPN
jgi:hypothetical protein